MNFYDFVISRERRMVAPLAGYPGLRLIGRSARQALSDAEVQLECLKALEKRLQPDIIFPLLDLTVEAEALGLLIDFPERKRPVLPEQKLPTMDRLYELKIPDPEKSARMPVFLKVAEGLRQDNGRMSAAFATGPFTLLAQLIGSETLIEEVLNGNSLDQAMGFTTSVAGEYAAALASRVDMVWVMDPAAGALSVAEFRSLYQPYVSGLAGIIRSAGAACILHICAEVSHITREMAVCGYDGLSLDSAIDLVKEAERLPKNLVLIGNIDARRIIQRGSIDDVRWETRRLLRHMGKVKNFVVSTACDVPVDVPIRNLETMIEETHNWKSRSRSL
jgi:uroporphyrinogen decarboxylase